MPTDQLTTEDIAKRIGVEPSTVRGYHSRRQMPPASGYVGRTPYWTPVDLEEWIEERIATAARIKALREAATVERSP